MINSIGSQNYVVQQAYSQTNTSNVEKATVNDIKAPEAIVNNSDNRKNSLSFIENATPEGLTARVNSLTGRMPSLIGIDMSRIINANNNESGNELLGRVKRLSSQVAAEMNNYLNQEQELIRQGRTEGQSDKDILMDIVKLNDEQSDSYKLAMRWGNNGLGSPETYQKLVELTPSYVNYYA